MDTPWLLIAAAGDALAKCATQLAESESGKIGAISPIGAITNIRERLRAARQRGLTKAFADLIGYDQVFLDLVGAEPWTNACALIEANPVVIGPKAVDELALMLTRVRSHDGRLGEKLLRLHGELMRAAEESPKRAWPKLAVRSQSWSASDLWPTEMDIFESM